MSSILVVGIIGESVFMECEKFPSIGETISIQNIYTEVGGKGFNQALTIHNLGGNVTFVCALGQDTYGEKCISEMKRMNIKHHCFIKKNMKTAYANILTDQAGHNQVCVFQGAKLEENDLQDIYELIDEHDYILLQLEVPFEINSAIMKYAYSKKKKVILNPAPAYDISSILEYCDIITPNEIEVQTLFGPNYKEKLLNRNFLSIITRGSKSTLLINECIKEFQVQNINPIDTTGAGDAFNGALVYCLSVGLNLHDAIKCANEVAGITIQHHYVLPGIEALKH